MCRMPGARGTWPQCAFCSQLVTLVRPLRRSSRPGGRRLERRPLRDPGRRLAHPRARARSTSRLDRLEGLGVDLVRFNLHWDQIEAARGKPDWEDSDARAQGSARARDPRRRRPRRLAALGERRPDARTSRPVRPRSRRSRARPRRATAWVKQWLVWNEPNQARWLRPTTARRLRPPAPQPRLRGDSRGEPAASRSAGGVTAPRALDWRRLAGRTGSAGCAAPAPASTPTRTIRTRRRTRETPFSGGCKHCETITMATLERLLAEVGRAFGPKRIWLTEYGYQTGRVRRQPAASGRADRPVRAARAQGAARRHADPLPRQGRAAAARFQSGLFQHSGRPKLAALAFPLPLAQAGRSGGKLVLWGQVRPRSGAQTFRVQVRTGGAWRFSGGVRRTGAARVLQRRRARRPRRRLYGSSRRRTTRTARRSSRASRDGSAPRR